VHEVIPYLLRRAQENSDIMGGVQMEVDLIVGELKNRKFFGSASA
jgi:proline dehydrogenase